MACTEVVAGCFNSDRLGEGEDSSVVRFLQLSVDVDMNARYAVVFMCSGLFVTSVVVEDNILSVKDYTGVPVAI